VINPVYKKDRLNAPLDHREACRVRNLQKGKQAQGLAPHDLISLFPISYFHTIYDYEVWFQSE